MVPKVGAIPLSLFDLARLFQSVRERKVSPVAWWVYILRCRDGSLYVGSTTDLDRRLAEHSAGCGAAYTRSKLPVALVYREPQPDRASAQRREWIIKKLPRSGKQALAAAPPTR